MVESREVDRKNLPEGQVVNPISLVPINME
jgi:hypothetical protein